MKLKMWIVKKEVLARNITEATHKPGRIFEVIEVENKTDDSSKQIGFKVKPHAKP